MQRRRRKIDRSSRSHRGTLTLLCLLAMLGAGCAPDLPAPSAVDGRLDLTNWDFGTGRDVVLRGDWEICWGQLLEPGQACPSTWRSVPVPATWTEADSGSPFGGRGVATYRLRVSVPGGENQLSIVAGPAYSSHRLWIDGVEVGGSGIVARSAEQASMDVVNHVYQVVPRAGEIGLLVQVANFEFRSGGLRRIWRIGRPDSIQTGLGRAILREGMVFSVGVLVGLSYLALFALGRTEQARGYFGLAALVLGLRAVPASISPFRELMAPWGDFELLTRLEYVGTAAAIFAGAGYVRTKVAGVAPPLTLKGVQLSALALASIMTLAPFSFLGATLPIQYLLSLVAMGIFVVSYNLAWVRRIPGVGVSAAASVLYLLVILHDIARTEVTGFGAPIELYPYAMVLWILAEGFDLLRRFYDTFIKVASLSGELTEANFELQETESAIMRFVPFDFLRTLGKQSIRDVDAGDRVRSEVSVLHCGFHLRDGGSAQTTLEDGFDALTALVGHAEPIVQQRGGFVNEFRSDGFQAFFPDDPSEAVAAALEILDAIDALREEPGPAGRVAIDISIGIDTGPVLLGTVGTGEHLLRGIVGQAVDGARLVEGAAHHHKGRVWISRATSRELDETCELAVRPVGAAVEDIGELFEASVRRAAC